MAEDDRDPKRPSHDTEPAGDADRAAILARRQRFIALALSGLAGTAACDKPKPQPCLSPPQSVDDGADDSKDPDTSPKPCLEVMPPEDTKGDPHPCLMVVAPQDPQEDPKAPTPQPCLKIAQPKPQPCLDVAPPPEEPKPQPCLRVAPPEPKPQPKPQPCLKVAPKGG
jgi:hypothetical protein